MKPPSRKVQNALTFVACSIGLYAEAQGIWHAGRVHHYDGLVMTPLMGLFGTAMMASALRVRRAVIDHGRSGPDGVILWGLAFGSALIAANAETTIDWQLFRWAAPLVAAVMLHRAMHAERKDKTATDDRPSVLGRLAQRVEARFGLADIDVSAVQLDRQYNAVAWSAFRGRLSRRAMRRALRLDAAGRRAVRVKVAALHQAKAELTADAVRDVDAWREPEILDAELLPEIPRSELPGNNVHPIRPTTEETWRKFSTPLHIATDPGRTKRPYRSAAKTRELYEEALKSGEFANDAEIAQQLGITPKALGLALAKTEPKEGTP